MEIDPNTQISRHLYVYVHTHTYIYIIDTGQIGLTNDHYEKIGAIPFALSLSDKLISTRLSSIEGRGGKKRILIFVHLQEGDPRYLRRNDNRCDSARSARYEQFVRLIGDFHFHLLEGRGLYVRIIRAACQ